MPDRHWIESVRRLRAAREPGVLVTLAAVSGHAPRDAGAKLVVGATDTWGSIGGGNIEALAIDRRDEDRVRVLRKIRSKAVRALMGSGQLEKSGA